MSSETAVTKDMENKDNSAKRGRKSVQPEEDYFTGKAAATTASGTAKGRGKGPLKRQPGMQSITNFFTKPKP